MTDSAHQATASLMRDGVIGRDDQGRATVSFERYFDHPPAEVWAALTDPVQARGWLGSLELEPRIGGRIAFRLDGTDPVDGYLTEGELTEYEHERLLACWIYVEDGSHEDDRHWLRFGLTPEQGGTLLNFVHTFSDGERARNSIVCGWHHKMEQISDTVDGQMTDWSTWNRDRIVELYWHYRNKPRS